MLFNKKDSSTLLGGIVQHRQNNLDARKLAQIYNVFSNNPKSFFMKILLMIPIGDILEISNFQKTFCSTACKDYF